MNYLYGFYCYKCLVFSILFMLLVNSRDPQVKRIRQEKAPGQEEEAGDQVRH